MIATLERPICDSVKPVLAQVSAPPVRLPPAPAAPPRLQLVSSASLGTPRAVPALSPLRPAVAALRAVPVGPEDSTKPLRITLRARRLLAGMVLIGCAAFGVVAVDVLSSILPFESSTSYPAQAAPYVAGAGEGPAALVPSTGSTVTVSAGDTLWGLAERVDPDADPRDVIAAIMSVNDLDSPALEAGQVLYLP